MKHHIQFQAQAGALYLNIYAQFNDEIIVLSGENGAGKSTLLRCIAGLQVAMGQIHIQQQVWLDTAANFSLPVEDRKLGFVWSESVLLPWLSIEKNIKLGVVEVDRRYFAKLVERFEISHLLKRKPTMLSTGESQRVALVRAIYRKPSILLLDEPFSAQAPDIRKRLRLELRNIQQELEIPMILVSHDMDDAKVLSHQHWRMREGTLLNEVQQAQLHKMINDE